MKIDFKDMLKAGIHFGHKTSRWHPKMRAFIWGSRNHVHLIDVSKTAFLLERAGKSLKELASNGGTFLFIGTKKPAQDIVKRVATNLKMPYFINRWIGGTLTNFEQVKKAILRYLHLQDVVKRPTTHFKKKEIAMIQKEIGRLEKNVGGIVDLSFPPAAIVVVDAQREQSAIKEALNLGIPVVAIVDTNTNPEGINFVIPSNDDSPRAIDYSLSYLESCIQEGIEVAAERKKADREKASASKDGGSSKEGKPAAKASDKKDSPKPRPTTRKAAKPKESPVKNENLEKEKTPSPSQELKSSKDS